MYDHQINNLTNDELVRFALNSRPEDNLVRELAERLDVSIPIHNDEDD